MLKLKEVSCVLARLGTLEAARTCWPNRPATLPLAYTNTSASRSVGPLGKERALPRPDARQLLCPACH